MAVTVFNPEPHPEVTTVDGWAGHDIAGTVGDTWATIRGAAGSFSNDTNTSLNLGFLAAGTGSGKWNYAQRGISLFNTTIIPLGATIVSATLEYYIVAKTVTLAGQSIVIVGSTPASNVAIANGDYAQLAAVAFCTPVTLASLTVGAYNTFTLNAAGLAAITLGGITKLGSRLESDRANAEPSWGSVQEAGADADSAEGTNKPKLTITYTLPPGGGAGLLMLLSWAGLGFLANLLRPAFQHTIAIQTVRGTVVA